MKFFENEKNELKIGKEKKRKRKERIYLNASLDSMSLHKGEIKVESEKKYIHFIVLLSWIR